MFVVYFRINIIVFIFFLFFFIYVLRFTFHNWSKKQQYMQIMVQHSVCIFVQLLWYLLFVFFCFCFCFFVLLLCRWCSLLCRYRNLTRSNIICVLFFLFFFFLFCRLVWSIVRLIDIAICVYVICMYICLTIFVFVVDIWTWLLIPHQNTEILFLQTMIITVCQVYLNLKTVFFFCCLQCCFSS